MTSQLLRSHLVNPSNPLTASFLEYGRQRASRHFSIFGVPSKDFLHGHGQYRFIADEKAVKNRMRSVKSIQKITKAMKMVAASKLRSDQRRRDIGLPFSQPIIELFERLPVAATQPLSDSKNVTLLCLTSDKGLCGGVHSAVAKLSRASIAREEEMGAKVSVVGVGDKIRAALQRNFSDRFKRIVNEMAKTPLNFGVAALLAERVLRESPGRAFIIHNKFKSAIAYTTTKQELLTAEQSSRMKKSEMDMFEFEPDRPDMWNDLYEFYVASTVYNSLLENAAAEQSARMSAMDNASKNAGEMLSNLTLAYNKARQMKITMELIEIISGANAL